MTALKKDLTRPRRSFNWLTTAELANDINTTDKGTMGGKKYEAGLKLKPKL